MPIISITFSGNRSLHVLFRLAAKTHEEWLSYIAQLKPALALIGADTQALTNHLVMPRLPGATRTVNGQKVNQELLYFNPRPSARPLIYSTPLRDVASYWSNRAANICATPTDFTPTDFHTADKACATYSIPNSLHLFKHLF